MLRGRLSGKTNRNVAFRKLTLTLDFFSPTTTDFAESYFEGNILTYVIVPPSYLKINALTAKWLEYKKIYEGHNMECLPVLTLELKTSTQNERVSWFTHSKRRWEERVSVCVRAFVRAFVCASVCVCYLLLVFSDLLLFVSRRMDQVCCYGTS